MPSRNQIHVDTLLSQISVKYQNRMFIADQVFPVLPVKKTSDLYRVYDRNFRLPETKRANKAESREHNFEVSTASYNLEKHSLRDLVSDDDADNYDIADLRADTTEELTDKILLRREVHVASLFTSTSWSQNVSLTSAQQWSLDTVTSNPIPVMDTAAATVLEQSGFAHNFSIIPHRAMIAVKNHSSIIERIKYTSINITEQMLAGLLDTPNLLVPKAVIDSSAEGVAASIAPIWGDNAFVGYKSPRPSPLKPSAGYIFQKTRPMVKRWREEAREGEMIEVTQHYQAKVVASLAGYLIKDLLG